MRITGSYQGSLEDGQERKDRVSVVGECVNWAAGKRVFRKIVLGFGIKKGNSGVEILDWIVCAINWKER